MDIARSCASGESNLEPSSNTQPHRDEHDDIDRGPSSQYGSSLNLSSQPAVSHGRARTRRLYPGPRQRAQGTGDAAQLREPGSPMDYNSPTFNTDPAVSQAAVSQADFDLIQTSHAAMDNVKMNTCLQCNERWFNKVLDAEGLCSFCQKDDKDCLLFSKENHGDPGEVPSLLPILTQTEELLIVRVHVAIKVHQHRGQQYHYKQLSIQHWSRRTFDRLPRLQKRSTSSC